MAKPITQKKAKTIAKARQHNVDAAKAKAIAAQKASVGQVIQMQAKKDGNSLNELAKAITAETATVAGKSKGIDIDVNVKGAMPLVPAPDGTKLKARRHFVADENVADITRLYESNSIGAEIVKIKRESLELQWKLASFCVAIAGRLQRDKEAALPILTEFMDAIGGLGKGLTVVRTNSFRAWFIKYAPVSWDKPQSGGEKTFLFDAAKHRNQASEFGRNIGEYFKRRASHPYWLVEPEKGFDSFDFDKGFAALMKRASEISAMSEEDKLEKFGPADKRQVKLGKFEKLTELLRLLQKEASETNNPATEEEKGEDAPFTVQRGEAA